MSEIQNWADLGGKFLQRRMRGLLKKSWTTWNVGTLILSDKLI